MKALSVPEIVDRLIDILVEVLEFDRSEIGEAATIRELGVTSLRAIELLEKINSRFDLYEPTSVVFEFRTVGQLARHLANALAVRAVSPDGTEDGNPAKASSYDEVRSHDTVVRSAGSRRPEGIDIAIVGLACRCAGANDQDSFWSLISEGRVCTQAIEREDWQEYFRVQGANAKAIRYGAISGVEFFDPLFFNISPKEAAAMDVSHRILLEESYKALEDAGYAPGLLKGARIGTYIGAIGSSVPFPPDHSHYSMLGSDTSILASRLAYHLDLKGPSMAINTSCSSSLVALDIGCRALRQGEIDLALTGGITIWGHPHPFVSMGNAGMLSPSGECRPFDSRADGILVGDGVGVLILKRLEDAERDRDSVYGIIRAIGTNQDGQTSGITVPSFLSQSALQREIYELAGINVEDIQYIEAHGTATKLGDPVEVHALTESFGKFTTRKGFCAIGSVKANIGHTAAAAGVLGVIKVLLSFRHRQLPPAVNFSEENPHIRFADSPVYVDTTLRDWVENSAGSRLAAVSSFGYSGTNAHLVLEQYSGNIESSPSLDSARPAAAAVLVPLSARTKDSLRTNVERLHSFLSPTDLRATVGAGDALEAIAVSMQMGRDAMEHRLAVVANSLAELRDRLGAVLSGARDLPGCWSGQLENGPRDDLLLGGDDESRELIYSWTLKRRLDKLARLWTSGASIDWMALYGAQHPRRVHLPTYGFAREPFPLQIQVSQRAVVSPYAGSPPPGALHPLLHRNTSNVREQRFTSHFTGREFFFTDHVIEGRRILPGAAYLEMARAAMEEGGAAPNGSGASIRLHNVVWTYPLVLGEEGTAVQDVDVHVGLFADDDGRIEFDVYTQPGDETERVSHCSGRASFGGAHERTAIDIDDLRASMRDGKVARDELYAAFEAADVMFGPAHRAVEVVYVGDKQVLARISLPRHLEASSLDTSGARFILHPSLMDAAFQASTRLALNSGGALARKPALPFTLTELSIHGDCLSSAWAWARLSSDGGAGKSIGTVDIDLLDDAGTVCLQMKGLGSRVMDSEAVSSARSGAVPKTLHPLVHHDRSTANRRIFESTFDGSEFFLDDHRVNGQRVLPGAAYIEMVRVAGNRLDAGDVAGLRNVVWAQPIRCEDAPLQVVVRFHADAAGYAYEVCTGADVSGSGGTVHCQGRLLLNRFQAEGSTRMLDIRAIRARCTVRKGHDEVAGNLRRVFGDYGTRRSFQAAEDLACNEREALVTLELPTCVRDGSAEYSLHPSMVNGAFEAAQLWSMVGSSDTSLQLPFAIEQVVIYGPLPARAHAHVRKAEGANGGAGTASYDIDIADDDGAIALSLAGYSPMRPGAARRGAVVYAAPCWLEQPLPGKVAPTQTAEPIFILAQSAACPGADIGREWPRARIETLRVNGTDHAESTFSSFLQVFRLIQDCVKTQSKAVQPVLGLIPEGSDSYLSGALSGLMRTAMRECPQIAGKIVYYDAASGPAPGLVAFLRDELASADSEVVIRRNRDGSRSVKRLEEIELRPEPGIPGPARGDVIWITGGLGKLGRIFAEYFASRFAARLILSGRSSLSVADREFLTGLERCGSHVNYEQCDVSNERQVAEVIARIAGRYGKLTGIIHNAGLIQDALIVNKTEEQIRLVLGPKIAGSLAIQRATQDLELRYFVLSSSFGALFGNPGQADYSAANTFLDAFADYRSQLVAQGRCHGRTISINWPLWRSGGMSVSREAELLMERATGMTPMDTECGVETFDLVLRSRCQQVLIAQGDAGRIRASLLNKADGRRLEGGAASRAQGSHPGPSVDATLIEEMRRGLVAAVSELQKIESARVDIDTPLSRYGFDSIGFTALANVLNRRYGFEEMPTVFFEHPDLRSVARHLVEKYPGLIRRNEDRSEAGMPVRGIRRMVRSARAEQEFPISAAHRASRIAIVGVAGKFPQSKNLHEFWQHLESNHDLIGEVPAGRWDWADTGSTASVAGERKPITAGGFLADVDRFDPSFFKISPREAEQMDPQLRILLETVWAAIEDAGYRASALAGRRIGVFAAVGAGGYRELWERFAPALCIQGAVGIYPFMVANRISYALDLHGPSEVIDTACSSSLVALHRAVESLRNGSCDMALVGGANIMSSPSVTLAASEAGVLSPDGRCKTFAKGANGYGRGEAVIAVLLKPLDQALEAGDRIHGVILGSVENHGGRATSPTAPNPAAQQALLVDAYTRAEVDPRTITYIEAHGTGTELGDPLEVKGLKGAFAELYSRAGYATGEKPHCGLGSVKTSIGHTEAASGLAGVIKVLLMLRHRKIPGNVHLAAENPYLQLEGSPFYLVRETREWRSPLPRRAGVSSFGVGGTNVHVILEELVHPEEAADNHSEQPHLIVLSARNEDRLREYAHNLLLFVGDQTGGSDTSSEDAAAPISLGQAEAKIRQLVAAVLHVNEYDLDPREPFENYGLDRALRALLLDKLTNACGGTAWIEELSGEESIASVARSLSDGSRTGWDGRLQLRNLAYTLQTGREPMEERLGLVVRSGSELLDFLEAFVQGRELTNLHRGCVAPGVAAGNDAQDAYQADSVEDLIDRGRYSELLSLWVKGVKVDWGKLYAGPKPIPISAPTYPFARERHWISDTGSTPLAPPKPSVRSGIPASAPGNDSDNWDGVSYLATWEEDPAESETNPRREHRTTLVVYSEPSFGIEENISSHCQRTNPEATLILVKLECETRREGDHRYVCNVDDPGGIDRCLGDYDRIDRALFLTAFRDPATLKPEDGIQPSYGSNEIQLLRLIKYLQRTRTPDAVVDFFVVTQDNFRAFGSPASPHGGGLTGLAYAVAQGDHRIRLRNIDVSFDDIASGSRQSLLEMILREPASDRGEAIKFRFGHRYAQRFDRLVLPDPGGQPGLKRGGVYAIVGGGGTVGRIITRSLKRDYNAEVVWIGRRASDQADSDGPSLYVQADATNLASLTHAIEQIKRRFKTINGAVFSAVVFDDRNSPQDTSEAEFRRILDVKTRGLMNFYLAFEHEPLDFLCSFSSGQTYSFSGAARLAAYATGITFADCLLNSLGERAPFPVGIVNWGFWKRSLDGVSVHDDIAALDDEEGFRCFERFVAVLRQGTLSQILCLKASEPVRRLMGIKAEQFVVCPEAGPPSAMPQLLQGQDRLSRVSTVPSTERGSEELNGWLRDLLFAQLLKLGAFQTVEQDRGQPLFGPKTGLTPDLEAWWEESLALLEKAACIARRNRCFVPLVSDRARDSWDRWDVRKAAYVADPEMRGSVELVDRCLRGLPGVLRGDVAAPEVLFPRSSLNEVKSVYTRDAVADYFNKTLAGTVTAYVHARVRSEPAVRLRILEIGAGTGGTTASVLEQLGPLDGHIAEYRYTDLSRAFLLHGQEQHGSTPYLRFDLVNVDEPLTGQRIESGAYDIVIAANVLHASRNVRAALWNIKGALRRSGLLVLNELVNKSLFAHLTFGLLDGWWRHDDAALRIPGSPLLSSDTWRRVLEEAGFLSVLFPAKAASSLGQQIIVAESDGFIKCTTAPPANSARRASRQRAPVIESKSAGSPDTDLCELVSSAIQESLCVALKIAPDSLDVSARFSDLGMDSLIGVGFVDEIGERLGIRLNRAIIFDYSSVERLTRYVIDTFGQHVATALVAPSPAPLSDSKRNRVDIAVVGMSGQFPGAEDVHTFWANLEAGRDGVGELPGRSEMAGANVWAAEGCAWGGVLENRDCFDPLFFNISPREALSMNPHQRLVLQEGWKAIEDAGYNPRALANAPVGVFIGAEPSGYVHESFTGASDAIIASRLSYFLDLKGPALVVNTGCSSSAVAIHLACQSLRQMESSACLAGGVFVSSGPTGAVTPADMLSPSGRSRTFDDRADGTVFSEGVGIVMLKRLADALADGDAIYGVIEASGINQDGTSNGIAAPNGIAQEALIVDVYRRYGIDPEDIGYVEAHGTGTKLGDPVEGNALVRAFRQFTSKRQYCAVGSAKAHVGHAGASAGVIGLIKVLLSLNHRRIPGLLHFERLNSLIEFGESAFYVSNRSQAWEPRDGRPRAAALNSFGHGGTNAHIVVAEYVTPRELVHEENARPWLILLSARSGERLRDAAKKLREHLLQTSDIDMADFAFTLQVGRAAMKERAAMLVDGADELKDRLKSIVEGQPDIERCWQGAVAEKKGRIRLFSSDDDMKELIGRWIAGRQLAKLAELWVQGLDLDWQRMHTSVKRRRLHLPTYVFEKEHYWAAQHRSDRAGSSGTETASGEDPAREVVRPVPEDAGPPGMVMFAPVWNRVPLADGAPVAPPVAARTAIVGGTEQQRSEVRRVYSRAFAIEACKLGTFEEVAAELNGAEPIDHVIWFAPQATTSPVTDESLLEEQQRGVLLVFRIVKHLLLSGYGDRDLSWTLVTTQTQATYAGEVIDPTHAGVHGLVGSIAREHPAWRMRLLDLSARHEAPLRDLFTLPFDARGNALACRNGQWLRQTLIAVRNQECATAVYRRGGVYVAVGGAGALGEVWSRWVIEKFQGHLIWIGRRSRDSEIQKKIESLSRFGPRPIYIQADARDRAGLERAYQEIKRIHPRVHGVIHSAVGVFDQSLAATDEARFSDILSAKVDVSVRIAQVFGAEPLELMLFFSSLSAFGKGGGLSGYAAGCTFADAFAHRLGTEWAGKVKVMNWGYWRIGAGERLTPTAMARLAHSGLGPIEPDEGMKALDQLLHSPLSQMACVQVLKPVALEGADPDEWMAVYGETIPSAVEAIPTHIEELGIRPESLNAADICQDVELEKLLGEFLYGTLWRLGWRRRKDSPVLTHLPAFYRRWLEESWRIIESRPHGEPPVKSDSLWKDWEIVRARWTKHKGAESVLSLLEVCMKALPGILTGERISTDVIFPNSSLHLVSGVYQGNPVADYFNQVQGQALVAYIQARRALHSASGNEMPPLRILEVGAGTGSATGVVLPKLKPFVEHIEEYCYTDISRAFLFNAQESYSNQPVPIATRLLDISLPLASQEIETNAFDVVIATNVLHATSDIRQALRNAKAALRRNGLLLLNEIRRGSLFGHLTFGLLEGWWRYEDGPLRIPGCPGLSPETWSQVLAEEGFRSVMALTDPASRLGQQVIAAESDGIVRQRSAKRTDAVRRAGHAVERRDPAVSPQHVQAGVSGAATSLQALREASTGYFRRLIGRTLRMESSLIDPSEPLLSYGMDSILIVQVTDKLREAFGGLNSTLLFETQSIEALVDYFLASNRDPLVKLIGLNQSAVEPVVRQQAPATSAPGDVPRSRRVAPPPTPHGSASLFDPIAIVGLSGRYPGAENLDELWSNLESGKDCIDELTGDRWPLDTFFHPDPHEAVEMGRSYSKWGGFLRDYACFDPAFFKISHLEALAMDPQERLFLECAWEAMEDAGYTRETLRREFDQRVGVFAGVTKNGYNLYAPELWRQGESTYPYTSFSSVANRVSYILNLRGPSFPIDTMCSSSLTAIHEACEHLQRRECDMAFAGGVNLYLHPLGYIGLSSQQMLSTDGRCRSFGAGANGFVPGEGVGVVLLKPLARAIQDRDRIHAVIRGTSVNHGGRTGGYTVPSPVAQGQVVRAALDRAGVSAEAVSYIEAHGTGTELGDPIEIQGLTSAFRKDTDRTGFCSVGSLKSNIGHLESAAGVAGLTKVVLQMEHRKLAPSLHAAEPNPHIGFESTPFVVQHEIAEWKRPIIEIGGETREVPRIAGVSSFGAGGSNAHVVIEEYIAEAQDSPGLGGTIGNTSDQGIAISQMILLSARTEERLLEQARRLLNFLQYNGRRAAEPVVELRDVAYTLQAGREEMESRLGLIVESLDALIEKLSRFLNNDEEIPGLYRGKVNPGGEAMSVFTADEDLAGAIEVWIEKRKYSRILELWVKGLSVDWKGIHETAAAEGGRDPKRIGLPTYPFRKERYWMPEQIPEQIKVAVESKSPLPAPRPLHPLVHGNTSDFATQRYTSSFTGLEPFLADHVVRGEKVLPAVAYMEMVRAAMSRASAPSGLEAHGFTLRDVVWLRPFSPRPSGRQVEIRLVAQPDGGAAFEVVGRDAARPGDGEVHCQGTAAFGAVSGADALDLAGLRASLNLPEVSRESLYDAFQAMEIDYGASHRCVETVFVGNRQVLAKLSAPSGVKASRVDNPDDIVLHIGLMDAALQASVALGMDGFPRGAGGTAMRQAGSPIRARLPFGAEKVEILAGAGAFTWAWVRYSDGSSPADCVQKLDIDCCDDSGVIHVRIRGFASKATTDRAANCGPGEASGLLTLSPTWDAVRAPLNDRLSPEPDSDIAIVGDTGQLGQAIRALYPNARLIGLESGDGVETIAKKLSASGEIEHLVWLPRARALDAVAVESVISDQETGVLQLFRIVKALLSLGYEHRDFGCTIITQQVHSLRPDDLVDPNHAGVHGLAGSLAKEYPQWRIRLLDLAGGDTCPVSEVFAQPFSADGDCLVRRSGQWWRQRLAGVLATGADRFRYRTNGTYVVIGGAGGIGEAWTRTVLSSHKARIVWIGRRGLDSAIRAKLDALSPLGPAPIYIQADASDLRSMERVRRQIIGSHGQIHGVIHSAITLLDRSLANMSEEDFLAALRAKIDVSVRLAQVFLHDRLDFVLFFSSLSAFGKNAGQGNYAAGCTFTDAFARRLAQEWPCPVKVMNWGYWGSVGIVADAAHRERMRRAGIGSIEPAEGARALEELLGSPFNQLAFIRTLRPDALGATLSAQRLTAYPEKIPSCIDSFSGELPERNNEVQHLIAVEARQRSAVEHCLLRLVWKYLRGAGISQEQGGLWDLASFGKLPGLHPRWLEETARMSEARGIVLRHGGRYADAFGPVTLDALWEQWDTTVGGLKGDPARAPLIQLLEDCLRDLPRIARGECAATDILFPSSSLDLVGGVYKGSPVVDYFSEVLANTVARYLEARLSRDPAAEIRLMEIGAGTGGTTVRLLPQLDRFRGNIKEYCYTDISRAFLIHAEEQYAPAHPYLRTRLFDVARPIAPQDIDSDRYDVVLATNVLHATHDIRWTLRNAKATMRRNGLLVLNEISDTSLLTHLTFGLLEGWWLYEDQQLRIPGCPGLYPEAWKSTLSEEGFRSVRFPAQVAHPLGQQIVIAESDGIVRQEHGLPSAPRLSANELSARAVRKPPATNSTVPRVELLRTLSEAYVRKMVASVLKMSPAEIDVSRPLEEYGVDSILVVRLTNALRKEFQGVTSTLLFEVQSIGALIDHLFRTQKDTFIRLVGLDKEAQPVPSPEPVAAVCEVQQRVAPDVVPLIRSQDVAVIGLSGRYPAAPDVKVFMANLWAGRNCITEVPRTRWNWEHYYDEKKGKEGRTYSKWGGFLDDVDKFDPLFFRISPREAARMDPQERLFLQIAYSAVEDAGYTPATLCGSRRVGVFVGAMNSMYSREPSHYSIANRISYLMDFTGPSLAVDTACSSSLTAIHLALESLYSGSCDCAIAGGVSLILDPVHYVTLSEMAMLSATDQCKPFGHRADGFVDGEGVGVVLLKPLSRAIADGDHIYGVIKGSMVNASGKTNGYTVPNPRAQAQLIREALNRAGVKARDVSYVEAHGTGTALGDPIEIAGLTQCFEQETNEKQFCAIGSVKSNIGHTESAAGIAGLTKVLLQMKEGRLAPSLHAEELNPEIDFKSTPFFVQRELAEWKRPACVVNGEIREFPRIAGISSFGAGGANAHLVIGEFMDERQPGADREGTTEPRVVVLSARDEHRLREMVANMRQFVRTVADLSLADLAYTLQVGREPMEERIAFIVRSSEELARKLDGFLAGEDVRDVFRGQVKRQEETLAVFSAADELRDAVEQWIRTRKYSVLLSLWVKGLVVDWTKLHEGQHPRRISAPTYPFARERYWAENPKAPISTSAGANGHNGNGALDGVRLRDRSFHELLLDRLSTQEIGVEDAIRSVRARQ